MPRTEASNLLLLQSGSKSFRRILVLLLALAATLVFGLESMVTLAMIGDNQPPARTPIVTRNDSAAKLVCFDVSVPRLQYQMAAVRLDDQKAADFSFDSRLEKQSSSNQRDLFQLVHKKLCADGRTGKWVDVAAGYGQICGNESSIGKNSVEWERPGCAYLKASFSF